MPPTVPPITARPQAKPVPPPAQPAQMTAQRNFTPPPGQPAGPNELQLPLQPILDVMPMELRARVKRTDTANLTVQLPLEKILTQLALGTVKITFGELRLAAPGVFSDASDAHDQKSVALPLNEILARLSPSLLSRRIEQKHVEVDDDITSPFGGQGQGLKISPPPAKPASPAAGVPPSRILRRFRRRQKSTRLFQPAQSHRRSTAAMSATAAMAIMAANTETSLQPLWSRPALPLHPLPFRRLPQFRRSLRFHRMRRQSKFPCLNNRRFPCHCPRCWAIGRMH